MRALLIALALLWVGVASAQDINTSGQVPNSALAAGAARTVKGNATSSTAVPTDVSMSQLVGTIAADAATAGNIGELISGTIAIGTPLSLSTATAADLTSITLTAGDWDVWLSVQFIGNVLTTVSRVEASVSLVSATLDYTVGRGASKGFPASPTLFNTVNQETIVTAPVRISVASNTTVFAPVLASFGVSTCSAYGMLQARRRR